MIDGLKTSGHVPVLNLDGSETSSKRAWQISIAVHALIMLALIIKLPWHDSLPELKVIKATIVELQPVARPRARKRPKPAPKPQVTPKPEPKPEPKPAPEPEPEVSAAELEATKQQQLSAERARKAQEQSYMEALLAEEEESFGVENPGLLDEYRAKIRQKVQRYWTRPPSATTDLRCEVLVLQMPGGDVTKVDIRECNGDDAVRRSIERAVFKASPLPLPSDPRLFERNLIFVFKPSA